MFDTEPYADLSPSKSVIKFPKINLPSSSSSSSSSSLSLILVPSKSHSTAMMGSTSLQIPIALANHSPTPPSSPLSLPHSPLRPSLRRRFQTLGLAIHRRSSTLAASASRNGHYTVGDFMTTKEHLHVVKPSTTVDQALDFLVEKRITGFPVIDDDWKLVGVVSDYDLLALDSISGNIGGSTQHDTNLFPDVDSSWKTFNEIQKLLSKTNGKVVGDLMTPAPLVVRETTNLEDAARLLLATKYRRLPVVDSDGKLVGIITRGNVVKAALQIKRAGKS